MATITDAKVKAMLKELGRVRRQQAHQRRRGLAQMRYGLGQGLNLIGYLIIPAAVVTVLLSL